MSGLYSFLFIAGIVFFLAVAHTMVVLKSHRRQRMAIAGLWIYLALLIAGLVTAFFW